MAKSLGLMLVAVLLAVGGSTACVSRCSADSDCVKTCPCENGGTCTVGLQCVNTFCEIEENPICQIPEDFCAKYSAKSLCGSKKCERTEQCQKDCVCPARVVTQNNQQANCCYKATAQFTCDFNEGLCDPNYAANTCEIICGRITPTDLNCTAPPVEGVAFDSVSCQTSGPRVGQ